jgi:large subunit ribosomal protein L31
MILRLISNPLVLHIQKNSPGYKKPYLKLSIMKKDLHPSNYRFVVFKDMSNGYMFLSRSTANSKEKIKYDDGNEYPVIKLEISNTSHPFYTGKNVLVDTAGRIDKFKKRYEKRDK